MTTNPDEYAIARPLLDPFTEDTTRRFREALDVARVSGDYDEVMRVSNLLAAEGMFDADTVLAIGLFKLSIDARTAGDQGEAALLIELIKEVCSPEAARTAMIGGYLSAGLRQGWLPEHAHDLLTEAVAGTKSAFLVARIERRVTGHTQ